MTYDINEEPTEATAYIKRLVYPGSSTTSATYLSGIIQTSNYDYVFHGDESSGKTYVTKQDPSAYPDMPEPLRPDNPEVDVDDTVDEYDGSGLPPASSAGGGRTKRKERNLRSGGSNNNPFEERIKLQVDGYLEKERRRQRRRMQSDDGSVIDILVSKFCRLSSCLIPSFTLTCVQLSYPIQTGCLHHRCPMLG